MSERSEKLAESIKFDVDRLANLAWVEEIGLEETPAPGIAMVRVIKRVRNGRTLTYYAVRQDYTRFPERDSWHCWREGGGIMSAGAMSWPSFAGKVLGQDNPIIESVTRYGAFEEDVFSGSEG